MTTLMWNVWWVLAFVLAFRGVREAGRVLVFMLVTATTTEVCYDLMMKVLW